MAIYSKQIKETQSKKHTLYILKRNIKNQIKWKKDVDKVNKVCYYPIVARRENKN